MLRWVFWKIGSPSTVVLETKKDPLLEYLLVDEEYCVPKTFETTDGSFSNVRAHVATALGGSADLYAFMEIGKNLVWWYSLLQEPFQQYGIIMGYDPTTERFSSVAKDASISNFRSLLPKPPPPKRQKQNTPPPENRDTFVFEPAAPLLAEPPKEQTSTATRRSARQPKKRSFYRG